VNTFFVARFFPSKWFLLFIPLCFDGFAFLSIRYLRRVWDIEFFFK
jgi:hypothetical protein